MSKVSNLLKRIPESTIENHILEFLNIKKVFAWKNQTVGFYDQKKGKFLRPNSRFQIRGTSDILGVFNGHPLAIEVKATDGKMYLDQKLFLESFNANHGIGFVARSIDEVEEMLFTGKSFLEIKTACMVNVASERVVIKYKRKSKPKSKLDPTNDEDYADW